MLRVLTGVDFARRFDEQDRFKDGPLTAQLNNFRAADGKYYGRKGYTANGDPLWVQGPYADSTGGDFPELAIFRPNLVSVTSPNSSGYSHYCNTCGGDTPGRAAGKIVRSD